MAPDNSSLPPRPQAVSPLQIAVLSFANMFSVGTVYALSTLQAELPRLLGVSRAWSFAPFGAACLGLSIGVGSCAPLIAKGGACVTASKGTGVWGLAVIGAGYFLSSSSFLGILACLAVGGIGVGWTYLAVVVMVTQGFPDQPLARSFIGPLGFSAGTAACIGLDSFLQFSSLSLEKLGEILILGGIAFATVGACTMPWLSREVQKNTALPETPANSTEFFFSILLFFNALPGMVAFDALLPMTSCYRQADDDNALRVLPCIMTALTFGGLFAPPLKSRLGARLTFFVLFALRGLALIVYSWCPGPKMALLALSTVLFAHGTGFSLLPALIKAELVTPSSFPYTYGRILTTWGAAGVVGILVNAFLISPSGEMTASYDTKIETPPLGIRFQLAVTMFQEYDFVVVGGGTTGSLIVSRHTHTRSRPTIALVEGGLAINKPKYRRSFERFSTVF
ncbi:Fc.00g009150.m01.CDS01 [Cosmosporella sp. VM-42]